MKNPINFPKEVVRYGLLLLVMTLPLKDFAQVLQQNSDNYRQFEGKVMEVQNNTPIAKAHLNVLKSGISVITNEEGEFSLKVPLEELNSTVEISKIGYRNKSVHLDYFLQKNTQIYLKPDAEKLDPVKVYEAGDARAVVQKVLRNRKPYDASKSLLMTGFYREQIERGSRNVSLSEAVVKIEKYPNTSAKTDEIAVYKARKKTDYKRLDTVAVKLRGGPYSPLYVDLLKYPQFLFKEYSVEGFNFSFATSTRIDGRPVYVINFDDVDHSRPFYFGQLYIDKDKLTLLRATYQLNVDDRSEAMKMFVVKKPGGTKVYPTETHYQVDYLEQDGEWNFSYGKATIALLVNWKNKLFNSHYTIKSELLITDISQQEPSISRRDNNYISSSVIMEDNVQGFADLDFWGANNIMEPDKPIRQAIEKIRSNMKK